jgi:hypothetical protein
MIVDLKPKHFVKVMTGGRPTVGAGSVVRAGGTKVADPRGCSEDIKYLFNFKFNFKLR